MKLEHWTKYRAEEQFKLTWQKAMDLDWADETGIESEYVSIAMSAFPFADRLKEYFSHRHKRWQEEVGAVINSVPTGKFHYSKVLYWREQAEAYKKIAEGYKIKHFFGKSELTIEPMTDRPEVFQLHTLKNRDVPGRATYGIAFNECPVCDSIQSVKKEIPSIPCLGYKDEWNGDFDCEYGSGITCEECICNGGNVDPRNDEEN